MTGFLTALVSVLVFGAVIFIHELGHYLVARRCGISVLEFSVGIGPAIWKTRRNGTLYCVRLLPLGGYVSMDDLEEEDDEQPEAPPELPAEEPFVAAAEGTPFLEAKPHKRLAVVLAGACMNFLLGFALLVVLVNQNEYIVSRTVSVIGEDALCGQTGLQVGDTILAVNGRPCFVAGDIVYELTRTENHQADFTVRRGGQRVLLPAVCFDTVEAEDGSTHMQLGFAVKPVEKNPLTVTAEAARFTAYFGRLIYSGLADMIRGRTSINDLSGPVGIVSAIGEAVRYGWEDVVNMMALLTINLGIMNLLPIPALDGGKALLILVEMGIRRPVPEKIQIAINATGLVLLFGLMIFATMQDILRLV